jgi:hypothetical protein
MNVHELIERTAARLAAPELLSEDPRHEALELIAHALGLEPRQLDEKSPILAHGHDAFLELLSRRLSNEPTGYIVGAVELQGLRFKVDRRGFIPRLDLPVLIEAGLAGVPRDARGGSRSISPAASAPPASASRTRGRGCTWTWPTSPPRRSSSRARTASGSSPTASPPTTATSSTLCRAAASTR